MSNILSYLLIKVSFSVEFVKADEATVPDTELDWEVAWVSEYELLVQVSSKLTDCLISLNHYWTSWSYPNYFFCFS